MTNTKPNPFANAQRVDTTALIMRRLKVPRKEAERLVSLKPGKVGALDFAALRLLNLDGADPREDHIEANAAYAFARSAHEEAAPIVREQMRSAGGSTTKRRADERLARAFAIVEEQVGKVPRRDAIDMAVKETALAIRNHAIVEHYFDALALGASPDEAREGVKPGKWIAFRRSLK